MSNVERLLKEATPLPWTTYEKEWDREFAVSAEGWDELATVYGNDDSDVLDAQGEVNALLIVYAVNHLPDYEAALSGYRRAVVLYHGCDRHPGEALLDCPVGMCEEARTIINAIAGVCE